MGKKSQIRNLGLDLKDRVTIAKNKVQDQFRIGQYYGRGVKIYRKLAPMEKHIDAGNCEYCTTRFNQLKKDPDILALPPGSDKEAMRIIGSKAELRALVKQIIDCPNWRKEKL